MPAFVSRDRLAVLAALIAPVAVAIRPFLPGPVNRGNSAVMNAATTMAAKAA